MVHVGDVEIMMLSDGALEFDPCSFFPRIVRLDGRPYWKGL